MVARQFVIPHLVEFDPELREAFLTVEDYLAELGQTTLTIQRAYNWRTETAAADPGNGNMRANAAPASATALYLSKFTSNGLQVTQINGGAVGDKFTVTVSGHADQVIEYKVAGPVVDNGNWWTLPVTYVSTGSGGFSPSQNTAVAVALTTTVGGGTGGGSGGTGPQGPPGPPGVDGAPGPPGPVGPLDILTDVNTAGETAGTMLTFDGVTQQWIPKALALSTGDLSDVSISPAPQNLDALRWDSTISKWVPKAINQIDYSEVFTTDGDGAGALLYGPPRTMDPPKGDALWFCTRRTVDAGGSTTPPVTGKPVVTIT